MQQSAHISVGPKRQVSSEHRTRVCTCLGALVVLLSAAGWWPSLAYSAIAATITKADTQTVLKTISGDNAKVRIYCQMTMLGGQLLKANERGDAKKVDELFEKIYALERKLGAEYIALIEGPQDIDPESEVGHEISATLDALDNLCSG